MNSLIKKVTIIAIILLAITIALVIIFPSGGYKSTLEKSDLTEIIEWDSTGNSAPSLSLLNGLYGINSEKNTQAEIVFEAEGLKKIMGDFKKFAISFAIADEYTTSNLTVSIKAASLNTGNEMRDERLLGEEFFDVKNNPLITFEANEINKNDTSYVAIGELTLLKSTNPIELPFTHLGRGINKAGLAFEAFEGKLTFDQTAYGMKESPDVVNGVSINFYCELSLPKN